MNGAAMLRFLILFLLLANGAYYAWSQGALKAYGYTPTVQSEPERLDNQLRPTVLTVLPPSDVLMWEEPVIRTPTEPSGESPLQ